VAQEGLQDFAIAFLSILLEGAPFILLGTLISGFIDVYLPANALERVLPRNKIGAVLLCGVLGIFLPVCECAVVPVIRRLVKKGLPVSCALTYMLAAPIVNPVTALSTWKAFSGQEPLTMLLARLGLGYVVAVGVGLIILRVPLTAILRSTFRKSLQTAESAPEHDHEHHDECCDHDHDHEHHEEGGGHDHEHHHDHPAPSRLTQSLRSAQRDFVDVGVYFAIGVTITALFNTGIAPGADQIDQMAENTVGAPATLMLLAFLLSLCSTSDAFIAATLAKFSFAARLAFLVFGPMMDIKLLFLYHTVLNKRFILLLALGLFVSIGALSILLEYLLL
jgi:uncharacterized membrane protein YraQ (UPF0718 family)